MDVNDSIVKETIQAIEDIYNGVKISYDGNNEINPFIGHCIGVKLDSYSSILLQVEDQDGDVFDIYLLDKNLEVLKRKGVK